MQAKIDKPRTRDVLLPAYSTVGKSPAYAQRRKTCSSCAYYENYTGACGNGRSENRGGFMEPTEYCAAWIQAAEKEGD